MKRRTPLTQWQRIKSVYPFLYAISYRASRWSVDSGKKDAAGYVAVAFVNLMLVVTALSALGDWLSVDLLPRWSAIPLTALLLGAQYFLFDRPKLGPRFEKSFDRLSRGERWGIGLYATCWVIVAGALLFVTIDHHRHLIGVG